jgi:hypothetical protein
MRHSVVVAAILILAAAPASGQISLGVAAGPTTPLGSLAEMVNPGLHGGVVLNIGLPLIPIAARGELMFQRLPGAGGNRDFDQVWAAANGRLDLLPLPLLGAYVTGGPGLYSSSYDAEPQAATQRSTNAGINIGVGVELNLMLLRPFIEARYHRVLTDPARAFAPITAGIYF